MNGLGIGASYIARDYEVASHKTSPDLCQWFERCGREVCSDTGCEAENHFTSRS